MVKHLSTINSSEDMILLPRGNALAKGRQIFEVDRPPIFQNVGWLVGRSVGPPSQFLNHLRYLLEILYVGRG